MTSETVSKIKDAFRLTDHEVDELSGVVTMLGLISKKTEDRGIAGALNTMRQTVGVAAQGFLLTRERVFNAIEQSQTTKPPIKMVPLETRKKTDRTAKAK